MPGRPNHSQDPSLHFHALSTPHCPLFPQHAMSFHAFIYVLSLAVLPRLHLSIVFTPADIAHSLIILYLFNSCFVPDPALHDEEI